MDKYSVIYKALELACKELHVVDNPNKAPLNSIISYYISEAEKELSLIDTYRPSMINNRPSTKELDRELNVPIIKEPSLSDAPNGVSINISSGNKSSSPSNSSTKEPSSLSEPNKLSEPNTSSEPGNFSIKEFSSSNSYKEKIFLESKLELVNICSAIFDEPIDYNLNYYKQDFAKKLDRFLVLVRNNYINLSKSGDLSSCLNEVSNSLTDANYRLLSCKERYDSSMLAVTSQAIHEIKEFIEKLK